MAEFFHYQRCLERGSPFTCTARLLEATERDLREIEGLSDEVRFDITQFGGFLDRFFAVSDEERLARHKTREFLSQARQQLYQQHNPEAALRSIRQALRHSIRSQERAKETNRSLLAKAERRAEVNKEVGAGAMTVGITAGAALATGVTIPASVVGGLFGGYLSGAAMEGIDSLIASRPYDYAPGKQIQSAIQGGSLGLMQGTIPLATLTGAEWAAGIWTPAFTLRNGAVVETTWLSRAAVRLAPIAAVNSAIVGGETALLGGGREEVADAAAYSAGLTVLNGGVIGGLDTFARRGAQRFYWQGYGRSYESLVIYTQSEWGWPEQIISRTRQILPRLPAPRRALPSGQPISRPFVPAPDMLMIFGALLGPGGKGGGNGKGKPRPTQIRFRHHGPAHVRLRDGKPVKYDAVSTGIKSDDEKSVPTKFAPIGLRQPVVKHRPLEPPHLGRFPNRHWRGKVPVFELKGLELWDGHYPSSEGRLEVTIGRYQPQLPEQTVDFPLDSKTVSRFHAKIVFEVNQDETGGTFYLIPVHGDDYLVQTWVNGSRITGKTPLQERTMIRFGGNSDSPEFTFRLKKDTTASDTRPRRFPTRIITPPEPLDSPPTMNARELIDHYADAGLALHLLALNDMLPITNADLPHLLTQAFFELHVEVYLRQHFVPPPRNGKTEEEYRRALVGSLPEDANALRQLIALIDAAVEAGYTVKAARDHLFEQAKADLLLNGGKPQRKLAGLLDDVEPDVRRRVRRLLEKQLGPQENPPNGYVPAIRANESSDPLERISVERACDILRHGLGEAIEKLNYRDLRSVALFQAMLKLVEVAHYRNNYLVLLDLDAQVIYQKAKANEWWQQLRALDPAFFDAASPVARKMGTGEPITIEEFVQGLRERIRTFAMHRNVTQGTVTPGSDEHRLAVALRNVMRQAVAIDLPANCQAEGWALAWERLNAAAQKPAGAE